jgi:hypothetical protein
VNQLGTEAADGFVASMLHDIGKLALDDNKQWPHDHGNLEVIGQNHGINFRLILGTKILEIIRTHHGNVEGKFFDISELNTAQIALAIADSIESSLTAQEDGQDISRTVQIVKFNPFFGNPTDFEINEAHYLLGKIANQLRQGLDVQNLIDVQSKILRYPSKHYLPHISLGVHHRLTAALYLFIYNKISHLNSPTELKDVAFYLTEIDPEPMRLFYRLRDAVVYSEIAEEINEQLFRKHYTKYLRDVSFRPKCNPFTFYYGSSMVFLSDEPLTLILHDMLEEMRWLNSIRISTLEMTFPVPWKKENGSVYPIFIHPKNTRFNLREASIVPERIMIFDRGAYQRCERCGIPIQASGESLCDDCSALRSRFSTGKSIDEISQKEGKSARVAYIFLNHPALIRHAREVARDVLINRFVRETRIPHGSINPTQYGFFEYLQALLELEEFQQKIWDETEKMNKGAKESVTIPLFRTGENLCIAVREDYLWEFLDYLNIQRSDLQLASSATIFIAQKKTPFWSLMNAAGTYKNQDTLYNVTRGETIMFSAEEINKIREMAAEAMRRHVSPHQFNYLSKFALRTTSAELGLELDRRADRLRGLNEELKRNIENLQFEGIDLKDKEKRSVFLKYIGDLVKIGRTRR